jgi:hypothetical protein
VGPTTPASFFLVPPGPRPNQRNKDVKQWGKDPQFLGPESTHTPMMGSAHIVSHFRFSPLLASPRKERKGKAQGGKRKVLEGSRRLPPSSRCRSSAGRFWKQLPAASLLFSTLRPQRPAEAPMRSPRSPRGGPRPPPRARLPPLRGPPPSAAARRCSAPTYGFPCDFTESLLFIMSNF